MGLTMTTENRMKTNTRARCGIALTVATALCAAAAQAQSWPAKPVRIIAAQVPAASPTCWRASSRRSSAKPGNSR